MSAASRYLSVLVFVLLAAYPSRAAYEWTGDDVPGGGNRAIVRVYLQNPPSHPSYAGFAHIAASTELQLPGGWVMRCRYSLDDGATWYPLGDMIREPDLASRIDLPHFAQVGTSSTIYAAIEHHTKPNDANPARRVYRIEVLKSTDYGRTWISDSIVASQSNSLRGYWAPFLFRRPGDDQMQCFFDDEVYPVSRGRDGQQCITRKIYDGAKGTWGDPVVVAFQPGMSRDGMATVQSVRGSGPSAQLLCVFESPEDAPPTNPTRVCKVGSADGGATWGSRDVVYGPVHWGYHALGPYLTKDWDGRLVVAFSTDEDRYPDSPGDNRDPATLRTDVKYVVSDDGSRWSAAGYVAAYPTFGSINLLWPGVERSRDSGSRGLVCQFARLSTDFRLRRGRPSPGPMEASPASVPLEVDPGADGSLQITYAPACGASDHVAYWGSTPIAGGPTWTGAACGLGVSGAASFDPGMPEAGQAIYFVIVGQTANAEGSYGQDGGGAERPFAAGLTTCGRPQDLTGSCP